MPLNKKLIVPVVIILVLGGITILKKQDRPTNNEPPRTKKEQNAGPEIIIDQATLNAFGYNKIKGCIINCGKNKIYQEKQMVICEDVRCKLTTHNNEIATLKTPTAQIDQKNKLLVCPSMVTGSFKDFKIDSDSAKYNSNDHKITANNLTLISKNPVFSIKSNNCSLDLKNECASFNNNVYSEITLHDTQQSPPTSSV